MKPTSFAELCVIVDYVQNMGMCQKAMGGPGSKKWLDLRRKYFSLRFQRRKPRRKILDGSRDTRRRSPCIFHFIRKFGVQNWLIFGTFRAIILLISTK